MQLVDKLLVVVSASTDGAVKEFDQLQRSAKQTDASMSGLSINAQKFGGVLKAGLAAAGGALLGGGLIAGLNMVTDRFVEAQTAAAQFARATNASVEEAGAFTTVARNFGMNLNDLIEINAEFSQKIKQQPELLKQLNVEVAKNADGSTNMTKTLVATIDALGQMSDGLEAARIASKLFGEEGSKQLAGFYLAGIKVSDLMDRIDFVDNSEAALKFSASTQELGLAFDQLAISVGSKVVPVLTDLVDATLAVFDFFTTLPGPVVDLGLAFAGTVGGIVAFNKAMEFLRSEAAGEIAVGLFDTYAKVKSLGDAFLAAEGAVGKAKVALGGFNAVAGATARVLVPLAVLFAAIEAFRLRSDRVNGLIGENILGDPGRVGQSFDELAAAIGDTDSAANTLWTNLIAGLTPGITVADQEAFNFATTLVTQTEAMLDNADASEAQTAAARRLRDIIGDTSVEQRVANLRTEEGTEAIAEFLAVSQGLAAALKYEVGASFVTLEEALTDLVLNGAEAKTTQEQLAVAVAEAADAQYRQQVVTDTTNGLLEAYTASTWLAVDATLAMFNAQYAAESAQRDLTEAIKKYNEERSAENADAVADAIWRVAAANTAAWEAEQKRYGAYPTQSQLDLKRIEELRKAALQVPEGTEVRKKLDAEVGRALAAWAAANPLQIPAGVDVGTVDTAIAAIKAQIAANEDPEIETQLALDLASLIALKQTIESAPPGEVPVEPVLRSGSQTAQQVVDPTGAPVGVTVVATVKDGVTAYQIVKGDGEVVDVTVTPVTDANGKTVQQVIAPDGTVIGVLVAPEPAPVTGGFTPAIALFGTSNPSVGIPVTTAPGTVESTKAEVASAAAPQTATVTVTTEFADGGYEANKARKDYLSQATTATITTSQVFVDGTYADLKARKDYLSQNTAANIRTAQVFVDGKYDDLKARKDYLSQNTTATVTVKVVGLEAARKAIADVDTAVGASLEGGFPVVPPVAPLVARAGRLAGTSQPRLRIPDVYPQYSPTNIFKIALEGTPLRAMIREEVGRLQPAYQGVA